VNEDDVPAERLGDILDLIHTDFSIMAEKLQGQLRRRTAGTALTKSLELISLHVCVKADKHALYLSQELSSGRRLSRAVKKDGIPFNLGHLQLHVIGVNDLLQKLFNDMLAMRDLRLVDELCKTTDIRDEKEGRLRYRRSLGAHLFA
jgi:hypothetical protein